MSELEKILKQFNLDCQSLGIGYKEQVVPLSHWQEQEDKLTNCVLSAIRQLLHKKVPEKIEETEIEKDCKILYSWNKAIDQIHKIIDEL